MQGQWVPVAFAHQLGPTEVAQGEKWVFSVKGLAPTAPEVGTTPSSLTALSGQRLPSPDAPGQIPRVLADTSTIGQERVDGANALANGLITGGHAARATVAEWKDSLNEAWADLLELLDTLGQVLAAAHGCSVPARGAAKHWRACSTSSSSFPDGPSGLTPPRPCSADTVPSSTTSRPSAPRSDPSVGGGDGVLGNTRWECGGGTGGWACPEGPHRDALRNVLPASRLWPGDI